jgi:hypothetical protein
VVLHKILEAAHDMMQFMRAGQPPLLQGTPTLSSQPSHSWQPPQLQLPLQLPQPPQLLHPPQLSQQQPQQQHLQGQGHMTSALSIPTAMRTTDRMETPSSTLLRAGGLDVANLHSFSDSASASMQTMAVQRLKVSLPEEASGLAIATWCMHACTSRAGYIP